MNMRQSAPFKIEVTHEAAKEPLRVTEPVRQIDTQEKRRRRIAQLSNIVNAVHAGAFARLAK